MRMSYNCIFRGDIGTKLRSGGISLGWSDYTRAYRISMYSNHRLIFTNLVVL